jgi:hypothetical protein
LHSFRVQNGFAASSLDSLLVCRRELQLLAVAWEPGRLGGLTSVPPLLSLLLLVGTSVLDTVSDNKKALEVRNEGGGAKLRKSKKIEVESPSCEIRTQKHDMQ